jgi:signal transduction histidine kinase
MTRRLLGPVGGPIVFFLIAALVFGGLGWVTHVALGVERAQRETAASAELASNLRVALWRLDGRMLPALGVEDSRPFYHYASADPDNGYGPAATPLLVATLPPWMKLHFQLDAATGWESPQVLQPDAADRVRQAWPDLNFRNIDADREATLGELRGKYPAREMLDLFASRERAIPADSLSLAAPLFVDGRTTPSQAAEAPSSQPAAPPSVANSAPPMPKIDAAYGSPGPGGSVPAHGRYRIFGLELCPIADTTNPTNTSSNVQDNFGPQQAMNPPPNSRTDWQQRRFNEAGQSAPPPRVLANPSNTVVIGRGRGQGEIENRATTITKAMQEAKQAGETPGLSRNLYGNYGQNYQPTPGNDTRLFNQTQGGGTNARNPSVPGPPLPPASPPGMPVGGSVVGPIAPPAAPNGPPSPQLISPAASPQTVNPATAAGPADDSKNDKEASTEKLKLEKTLEHAPGKSATHEADRADAAVLGEAARAAKDVKEAQDAREERLTFKASDLAARKKALPGSNYFFRLMDEACEDPKARPIGDEYARPYREELPNTRKGSERAASPDAIAAPVPPAPPASVTAPTPPPAPPLAIHLGSMRPQWITGHDGSETLVLVRTAKLDNRTVYQGVVLDWANLEAALKEEVKDLFPDARLVPVTDPAGVSPDRAMTALPVQLDPGPQPQLPPAGWTTLRLGLVMAWVAAFIAFAAVGFSGWTLIDLAERRIRFVSAVTHELRTPLTSLRLYLDLLVSGMVRDEDKKQEYLNTLAMESDRLHRLIDNVLDYAKLEKRGKNGDLEPVCINELIQQIGQVWTDRVAQDGKQLVVISTLPQSQQIHTDAGMVQQILGNLIDNARKYTREAVDKRIWLWAKPGTANRIVFEVEDRGSGVPANERRSIFKPFRRGDWAESKAGGAGLGLALAKSWAEALGGRLTYRPADGNSGACFRLELPG